MLKNKLGFDDAFNYKEEPDLAAALKRFVRTDTNPRESLLGLQL